MRVERLLRLVGGAALLVAAAVPGLAQPPPPGTPAQEIAQTETPVAFNIPAGPLPPALAAFGDRAGLQVLYPADVARGLSSTGASGTMTPSEALRRLLSGTGLVYRFTNATTVTVERPGAGGQVPGVMQLDSLQVQGYPVPPQAMIDNLPPVYPGGQVARGGQLGLLGNRDIMDTPFNQTSYTAKRIKDEQARTIADVLQDDPSVRSIFAYGGLTGEAMNIRGFYVAPSDMLYGGLAGVLPYWSVAPELAERVEVLKGPSAFLNGMPPTGSIGGTINLVPKRAGDEPLTQVTGSYASNAQFGGHLDIGRRFGPEKQFGIRFNGVYRGGETAVQWNNNNVVLGVLGLDFRGERVRLAADFGYQQQRIDGLVSTLTVAAGLPIPIPPTASKTYSQPWAYTERRDLFGALRGEFDLTERTTAYAAFGARDDRVDIVGDLTPSVLNRNGNFTSTPYRSNDFYMTQTLVAGLRTLFDTGPIAHAVNLNVTGLWQQSGGSGLTRGTTFSSNIYNPVFVPQQNLVSRTPVKASDSTLTSLAFADTISAINGRIQVTFGARQQYVGSSSYNATTGALTSTYGASALSPSASIVLKPWQNVSVYGNFIEGLQQGVVVGPTYRNAGEIFPPYKSKQYEAGIKADWGTFGTTFSAFQITQPSAIANTVTNTLSANGEQRNRGIEINTFGEPIEGVRLLGGVMFLDAILVSTAGGVSDGWTAPGAPDFRLNLGGEWDTPFVRGLTLNGRVLYTSSQYVNVGLPRRSIPDWTRFDLGARYTFERAAGSPVTFRFNVENVLDTNYWSATFPGSNILVEGAPRTFLLSLTANF